MSQSPEGDREVANTAAISVENQDARRLPRLRPEKYVVVEIRGRSVVTDVAVATSMQGLL